MNDLSKIHREQQLNINAELRKDLSNLQKKMMDDAVFNHILSFVKMDISFWKDIVPQFNFFFFWHAVSVFIFMVFKKKCSGFKLNMIRIITLVRYFKFCPQENRIRKTVFLNIIYLNNF